MSTNGLPAIIRNIENRMTSTQGCLYILEVKAKEGSKEFNAKLLSLEHKCPEDQHEVRILYMLSVLQGIL